MLGAFGRSYRRPLVLMRAMMLEMARTSSRKILIAPCCCSRMTSDEALMMQAIGGALRSPRSAYEDVAALLGNDHALGALTCLQAVAQAHCDLGRPLDLYAARYLIRSAMLRSPPSTAGAHHPGRPHHPPK